MLCYKHQHEVGCMKSKSFGRFPLDLPPKFRNLVCAPLKKCLKGEILSNCLLPTLIDLLNSCYLLHSLAFYFLLHKVWNFSLFPYILDSFNYLLWDGIIWWMFCDSSWTHCLWSVWVCRGRASYRVIIRTILHSYDCRSSYCRDYLWSGMTSIR